MNLNSTGQSEVTIDGPQPEPLPDWSVARDSWRWAWALHTYGLGGLYVLGALASVGIALGRRRRIRSQPSVGALLLSLCQLCVLRAVFLLVDPYHSTRVLPVSVIQLVYGLAFPIIITACVVLERVLARLIRFRCELETSRQSVTVTVVLVTYFVLVSAIYLTVSLCPAARQWLILCQSIFVTWGFAMCFIIVYKCYRMSQYTTRTNAAMRQILAYARLKRELRRSGSTVNPRNLALLRIAKTPLDINQGRWSESGVYCSAESENRSTDSDCFYNISNFSPDEDGTPFHFTRVDSPGSFGFQRLNSEGATTPGGRTKKRRWCGWSRPCSAILRSRHQVRCSTGGGSDGEGYDTETQSTDFIFSFGSRCGSNQLSEEMVAGDVIGNHVTRVVDACALDAPCEADAAGSEAAVFETAAKPSIVLSVTHINKAFDCDSDAGSGSKSPEVGLPSNPGDDRKCKSSTDDEPEVKERGYLADTEIGTPLTENNCAEETKAAPGHSIHRPDALHQAVEDLEMPVAEPGSPLEGPYPLPFHNLSLGLHRIVQGCVIQTVLRITYLMLVGTFSISILQVYAMFGVYGVLSNERVASPWPWFTFQTLSRLSELIIICSQLWITFSIGRQRARTILRKRPRDIAKTP